MEENAYFKMFSFTVKSALKITFLQQSTPARSRLEKLRRVTGKVIHVV